MGPTEPTPESPARAGAMVLVTAMDDESDVPEMRINLVVTTLDTSRAELSAEQFSLLSRRLAAAESAYAELTTVPGRAKVRRSSRVEAPPALSAHGR